MCAPFLHHTDLDGHLYIHTDLPYSTFVDIQPDNADENAGLVQLLGSVVFVSVLNIQHHS